MNPVQSPMPPLSIPELIDFVTTALISKKAQFETLVPHIPHLTPSLLVPIFASKTLARHPNTLISFFKWCQSHNPSISRSLSLLLSLLPPLLSYRKFPNAKSLLVAFILSDQKHDLHKLILSPYQTVPRPSKDLLDTSTGAYVQCGHPHMVVPIFDKMKRFWMWPNLLTCNTLLNVMVKYPSRDSILLAVEVFSDVLRIGVSPNTRTCNIVICGYCLENRIDNALEFVNEMVEEFGCVPDNVTYNTILDVLCKRGRLKEVRDLLHSMKDMGLVPDRNTFNILVYGYCRLGWLKEANEVIDSMMQNNMIPDVWTYNELIRGFCKEGKLDQAFRVKDDMENSNLLVFEDSKQHGVVLSKTT